MPNKIEQSLLNDIHKLEDRESTFEEWLQKEIANRNATLKKLMDEVSLLRSVLAQFRSNPTEEE